MTTTTTTTTTPAANGTKITFETTACGRCGGSGSYSYCQMHGSTCFECGGSGKVFTKRGHAAQTAFRAHRLTVAGADVETLAAGARVFAEGKWRTVDGPAVVTAEGTVRVPFVAKTAQQYGSATYAAGTRLPVEATPAQWAEMVAFAHATPGALVDGVPSDATVAADAAAAAREERLAPSRQRAAERRAAKAAAAEAAEAERLAAAVAAMEAAHADLLAECAPLVAAGDVFVSDVVARARRTGVLTDAQAVALRAAVDRATESRAAAVVSSWVGEVGARVEVPVLVVRCGRFERPSFTGFGAPETVHVVTMADAAGNFIVSKSPRFRADVGDRFTLRATVKEHDTYRDARQTVVIRAKAVAQ